MKSNQNHTYYGCSHPASIAAYLHQQPRGGPHIIQTRESLFASVKESFLFFNPDLNIHILPALDPWFPSRSITLERVKWLYHASRAHSSDIFLCSKESLSQKTLPIESFQKNIRTLKVGSLVPTDTELQDRGYISAMRVEEIGFFARRGGFLDIFSPAHPHPIRIESIGDEIEKIYFFNPETQQNIYTIQSADLILASEFEFSGEMRLKVAQKIRELKKETPDYFFKKISQGLFFHELALCIPLFYESPSSALSFFKNPAVFWIDHSQTSEEKKFTDSEENNFSSHMINQFYMEKLPLSLHHSVSLHPLISDSSHEWPVKVLNKKLSWNSLKDFKNNFIFVTFQSETQKEQIKYQLQEMDFQVKVISSKEREWNLWKEEQMEFSKGVHLVPFELPFHFQVENTSFLRGDQLLGKPISASRREQSYFNKARSLKFSEIKEGDLIVDRINGVGRYRGLKQMKINQSSQEFLELEYKNKDKLYIPVTQLSRLFQFKTQLKEFTLDQLSQPFWKRKLAQAQRSIQEMVLELIQLYSLRAKIKRPAFKKPELIEQFEKEFPFEETLDQLKTVKDIFQDMYKDSPMDRLIIGDSGYGKTEVAMRAMFLAVENGYQVAFLAPTTVLTMQHFENLKKRFSSYPIRIGLLNRLVSREKIKHLISDIQNHKVDIVVGSHRLLSSDVQFKKLGLFVVDEEQRFGVRHKEKLKKMNSNMDCIYMSATPIPRTLNMSLSGMKNISVIQTPPKDRILPQTAVISFQEEKIKRAILNEIQRGGQVLFVHNRVQSLEKIYDQLSSLLPQAQIGVAHGQMKESTLESRMIRFFKHEYDILLCTTIIETGMDFERANTIIINNAHQFGMSQLYQMKGRVGRRAHIQPYCYFILPENIISDPSMIERFNHLQTRSSRNSGYQIARYDLERRGGGELFGTKQTGHIKNIGYDLYLEILDSSLHPSEENILDIEIKLPWAASIPSTYMPDEKMRLMYYKHLCDLKDTSELKDLEKEWEDSFGPIPVELKNLLGQVIIQQQCRRIKIKELKVLGKSLHLIFQDGSREKIQLPEEFSWVHIHHVLSQK